MHSLAPAPRPRGDSMERAEATWIHPLRPPDWVGGSASPQERIWLKVFSQFENLLVRQGIRSRCISKGSCEQAEAIPCNFQDVLAAEDAMRNGNDEPASHIVARNAERYVPIERRARSPALHVGYAHEDWRHLRPSARSAEAASKDPDAQSSCAAHPSCWVRPIIGCSSRHVQLERILDVASMTGRVLFAVGRRRFDRLGRPRA